MPRTELHEMWRKRMKEFGESGQSATAWCAVQDIQLHRFWYWSRKLREQRPTKSVESIRWLAVTVDAQEPQSKSRLTVRVGGACIDVTPGFEPELLREVVEALSHA